MSRKPRRKIVDEYGRRYRGLVSFADGETWRDLPDELCVIDGNGPRRRCAHNLVDRGAAARFLGMTPAEFLELARKGWPEGPASFSVGGKDFYSLFDLQEFRRQQEVWRSWDEPVSKVDDPADGEPSE